MNVLSNVPKGQQILNSLHDTTNRGRKRLQVMDGLERVGRMDDAVLFDDTTAVIVISLEGTTLGRVLQCNDAVASLFGRARSELEGQNINTIVPNPWSEIHDNFLRLYMETAQERVVNRVRRLFGLHKNGYVFPIQLLVKQVSGGLNATTMMGVLTPLHVPNTDHYAVVDVNTGAVLRCTSNFASIVDISLHDMLEGQVNITSIIPDYYAKDTLPADGMGAASAHSTPVVSTRRLNGARASPSPNSPVLSARGVHHAVNIPVTNTVDGDDTAGCTSALRSEDGVTVVINKENLSTTCQVYVQRMYARMIVVDILRVVEKQKRSHNLPGKHMSPQVNARHLNSPKAASPMPRGRTQKKTHFDDNPELFAIDDDDSDGEVNGGVEYVIAENEINDGAPAAPAAVGDDLTITVNDGSVSSEVDPKAAQPVALVTAFKKRKPVKATVQTDVAKSVEHLRELVTVHHVDEDDHKHGADTPAAVLDQVRALDQAGKAGRPDRLRHIAIHSSQSPVDGSGDDASDDDETRLTVAAAAALATPAPVVDESSEHDSGRQLSGAGGSAPADTTDSGDAEDDSPLKKRRGSKTRRVTRKGSQSSQRSDGSTGGTADDSDQAVVTINTADNRSQSSRGSKSSMSVYLQGMDRVRALLLSPSKSLDPVLNRLRWAFIFTVGVIIIMVAVGYANVIKAADEVNKTAEVIQRAQDRSEHLVRIRLSVSRLTLVQAGLLEPRQEAPLRATLAADLIELKTLTDELYLEASSLSGEHRDLYESNGLRVEQLIAQQVSFMSLGLWTGLNEFLSHGQLLIAAPLSSFTSTDPNVFWIMVNSDIQSEMVTGLRKSSSLYRQAAEATVTQVRKTQLTLMVVTILIVFGVVFLLFPPTIARVFRTRDAVFHAFLSVPFVRLVEIQDTKKEELTSLGRDDHEGG